MKLISAIAALRAEDVAGQAFAVHTHERRLVRRNSSLHEREVVRTIQDRAIKMQVEIAVIGRQPNDLFAFN